MRLLLSQLLLLLFFSLSRFLFNLVQSNITHTQNNSLSQLSSPFQDTIGVQGQDREAQTPALQTFFPEAAEGDNSEVQGARGQQHRPPAAPNLLRVRGLPH